MEAIAREQMGGRTVAGTTTPRSDLERRRAAERDTKIGKAIFYSTLALSIWFFYWLAGIQCPC